MTTTLIATNIVVHVHVLVPQHTVELNETMLKLHVHVHIHMYNDIYCTYVYLFAMSHTRMLLSSELPEVSMKRTSCGSCTRTCTCMCNACTHTNSSSRLDNHVHWFKCHYVRPLSVPVRCELTENEVLARMEEDTRDIVVMATTSVHLPGLGICSTETETERERERVSVCSLSR